MPTLSRLLKISSATAIALFIATSAPAAMLAGYPAPGGTSYAAIGSPLHDGGQTATYSGFDPTAFGQLWWGVEELGAAMDGAIDAPGESMSLFSMSGAVAVWKGTTSVLAGPVFTRLTATIVSGAGDWIDPLSVGITSPEIYAATEVDATVDFVVHMILEASFDDISYASYLPFFDANTGPTEDGNSRTSYYRNFYYTPVPLPAALPLALAGVGALAGLKRRSRKAA